MTDKIIAFSVTLQKPTRTDDVEDIVNAIKMVKGVQDVVPHVADIQTHWARSNALRELQQKLRDVLNPTA